MHAYFHFMASKPFKKKGPHALDVFIFEEIRPHVEKNTASGNAWKGAVERGHFYVYVNKRGSVFEWTNFPPMSANFPPKGYGVQGYWLDEWLRQTR